MATLTREQTAQLAYQAGFRGTELAYMTAIPDRESDYQTDAQNPNGEDTGLWQINWAAHGDALIAAGIVDRREDLYDPWKNAQAAFHQSGGTMAGIDQMWGADASGWVGPSGDPLYGTDYGAATAAVQNASEQGLLGEDWDSDEPGEPQEPEEDLLSPEEREEMEAHRKLGNMGFPDYRRYADAPRKHVTARQAVIERLLDENEEDDPAMWARTARRLGNQGFKRFGSFSTLGEDALDEAQASRWHRQLGNLGMDRFNKAATAPERAQNLRSKAILELLGEGEHTGKEWMAAAQKLGNRGMQRFQPWSTLPEDRLEKRQAGYQERMEGQKVMTSLLADLGIDYPNAPRPTPALLAYLRGVGLDIDQAEQMRRRGVQRIRSTAAENKSDFRRSQGRAQRGVTTDLVSRGVLSSGEANRRYTEHAIDTAEGMSDINRARRQGVQDTRFGFSQGIEQIKSDAAERLAQEEESQATTRATNRATARQYRQQRRASNRLARQLREANEERNQALLDAINRYGNRGIPVT